MTIRRPPTAAEPTIAGLATPPGHGGLAVVRLSGHDAVAIARRIFAAQAFARGCISHRAYFGPAVWPADAAAGGEAGGGAAAAAASRSGSPAPGELLDEVVLLPFLAPRSYTGEDTVEIHCHGGRLPADRILRACLAAGARAAGPGEFTRRAFLNGRLSLDRAEAVADLVAAESDLAAGAALRQLRGGLDAEVEALERPLRELLADLEGSFEFSEQEEVAVAPSRVAAVLARAVVEIEGLLALAPAGRRLREGVRVVLAGAPNVGKSSLLNALLGSERAIVDAAPGTTRDVVGETIDRGGLRFRFEDTAGLRRSSARVESEGIRRSCAAVAEADLVLVLREAGAGSWTAMAPGPAPGGAAEARGELERLAPGAVAAPDAVVLPVWTKADLLPPETVAAAFPPAAGDRLLTSAVTGLGVDALWDRLLAVAAAEPLRRAVALGVMLNARHRDRLAACARTLRELQAEQAAGPPPDEVVAGLLSLALAELGELTGRVFSERLLDEIFSRFCVGK